MLDELRTRIFSAGEAGTRCLLDEPVTREVAQKIKESLVTARILPAGAKAIQTIAFGKTPGTNWKVTWHQDVMFPFAKAVHHADFDLPSKKGGIDYARPPRPVLEEMLAVRLHLDGCDESNGPLRVSPGSHTNGILRSMEIPALVIQYGETVGLAKPRSCARCCCMLRHQLRFQNTGASCILSITAG
ncbi:MAG: phytanoyl-CoA dioxygenase family protein [Lacunisphaera sp.]